MRALPLLSNMAFSNSSNNILQIYPLASDTDIWGLMDAGVRVIHVQEQPVFHSPAPPVFATAAEMQRNQGLLCNETLPNTSPTYSLLQTPRPGLDDEDVRYQQIEHPLPDIADGMFEEENHNDWQRQQQQQQQEEESEDGVYDDAVEVGHEEDEAVEGAGGEEAATAAAPDPMEAAIDKLTRAENEHLQLMANLENEHRERVAAVMKEHAEQRRKMRRIVDNHLIAKSKKVTKSSLEADKGFLKNFLLSVKKASQAVQD